MKIKETIVVEGRDDTTAVRRAVDCLTLETHGYGIRPEVWELMETANRTTGIIVFTDPDHAGNQIRKRITDRFPDAKQAFLDRKLAEKDGDIGIENASPESIRDALKKARCMQREEDGQNPREEITMADMVAWGLCGRPESAAIRDKLGAHLGIGHANGKSFCRRLNAFGFEAEEIERTIRELEGK